MASVVWDESKEFLHVKCPFHDRTGCDFAIIVKGYCEAGKHCIQDCAYTWLPAGDKTKGDLVC